MRSESELTPEQVAAIAAAEVISRSSLSSASRRSAVCTTSVASAREGHVAAHGGAVLHQQSSARA